MVKRYFVLGTDTDCGKTFVTCQLLALLKQRAKVFAIKPIATGCVREGTRLISEDAVRLAQYNGATPYESFSWRFEPPVSPHLAAEAAGVTLTVQALMQCCFNPVFDDLDYLLIEGAGGLMVPLNQQDTWVDFLSLSQLPVIVVVGLQLGCINHALLTAHVMQDQAIECVGWVANGLDPSMQALPETIATLSTKLPWPLLTTIPHGGTCSQDSFDRLNLL